MYYIWAASLAGYGRWLPTLRAATGAPSAQPSEAASRSPTDTRRLQKGMHGHTKAHIVALEISTCRWMALARLRTIPPLVP